jgi:integrase
MAQVRVVGSPEGHRLIGDGPVVGASNRFLEHLRVRAFSPATARAYAFDLANFAGFLADRSLELDDVAPSDLFDYLDWQASPVVSDEKVVALRRRGAAPATMNRRIAAVRGLFEHLVVVGERAENPVPAARRTSGLRGRRTGLLGHVAVRSRSDGRLVRQPQRLPESVPAEDVAAFVADLDTHRDRAMALAMVLGGLRAAEVRSLRLADVDMGPTTSTTSMGSTTSRAPITSRRSRRCRPESCCAPHRHRSSGSSPTTGSTARSTSGSAGTCERPPSHPVAPPPPRGEADPER